HSDSELMVKQMNGEYRVKNPDLLDLYEEASALAAGFTGGVRLVHVRRERNRRADELCNEALDGKRAPRPRIAATKPLAVAAAKPPTVTAAEEEAIALLRAVEVAWRRGDTGPSPYEVWDELRATLGRHGVTVPQAGPYRASC